MNARCSRRSNVDTTETLVRSMTEVCWLDGAERVRILRAVSLITCVRTSVHVERNDHRTWPLSPGLGAQSSQSAGCGCARRQTDAQESTGTRPTCSRAVSRIPLASHAVSITGFTWLAPPWRRNAERFGRLVSSSGAHVSTDSVLAR
jgi:hypothetical protein